MKSIRSVPRIRAASTSCANAPPRGTIPRRICRLRDRAALPKGYMEKCFSRNIATSRGSLIGDPGQLSRVTVVLRISMPAPLVETTRASRHRSTYSSLGRAPTSNSSPRKVIYLVDIPPSEAKQRTRSNGHPRARSTSSSSLREMGFFKSTHSSRRLGNKGG